MHYVKHFNINGVDTRQIACIELHGKPNAATVGAVGVLGIDVDSPLHDVYKCVAVNGSIYTWELLSSGLSIMSATITGNGLEMVEFPYSNLKTPALYVVKIGDLILDSAGYLYRVDSLDSSHCVAIYCGTHIGTCIDYGIVYPVGSIYMSVNNTSPASLFGGIWEQIKDRFLLAAGDTYDANTSGGSADAVVVEHTHDLSKTVLSATGTYDTSFGVKFSNESAYGAVSTDVSTKSQGTEGTGKNMPPYLTVYVWKRVA